jgi:hypothetical protein
MFPRALLLLLLVLNAGVAAWWLLRPPAPPAALELPSTAPRLRLVAEVAPAARPTAPSVPAAAASTTLPHAASVATPATAVAPERCLRLGPFDSDAALASAQSALRPQVARLAVATLPASARGWRVWLPALADRAAAQAVAARIAAAGITDYYIVADGDEANSIALGRYGNAESAQRRQAQLQAAGVAAQAQPLGGSVRWIDVAVHAADNDAALRASSGARQSRTLDCARLH